MSDLYYVDVVGDRNALRNLERMPEAVRTILAAKIGELTEELEDLVIQNIESRLGEKTGRLAGAVKSEVIVTRERVEGRVYVENVPYARIQDKGGVIAAHIIRPYASKILAFIAATGDKVFVTQVFHPGATIAPKNFTADARRQIAAKASRAIKNSIVQGIRRQMREGQ